MVAAAPKRGNQLTLCDDESGTDAARQQPAPQQWQSLAEFARLSLLPDPEAWLEKQGGLCVPQSCVDAMGEQFRRELERVRSQTGRVLEDKDGWHALGAWIVANEKGVWGVAHKIVRANLSGDVEEVFSDLCAQCMSWAKWVRPWVERKGEKRGAKFLTVVQTFGIRKFVKARPYQLLAGQFCEDYQEEAVPARDLRANVEACDEVERALGYMEPFERHAVSEHYIHGVPLRELAAKMDRRVRDVEALIQSGFRRALMARGGAE